MAEDGNITKWTEEDIAEYGAWDGDVRIFKKSLLNGKDGFINEKDGLLLVHDWLDYAGRYLKAKYKTNNPNKLNEILSLYGKTKVRLKTDFGKPYNQYNQYNQPIYNIDVKKVLSEYRLLKDYKDVPNSFYARNTPRAQVLVKELGVDKAIEAIKWWANFSEKEGLDWTLETVVKKIPDFLKWHNRPELLKKLENGK